MKIGIRNFHKAGTRDEDIASPDIKIVSGSIRSESVGGVLPSGVLPSGVLLSDGSAT